MHGSNSLLRSDLPRPDTFFYFCSWLLYSSTPFRMLFNLFGE